MEKLIVTNFLNIKHIELELGKINLLIGPQAQGKSVVAKLVYFFQSFWDDYSNFFETQQFLKDFEKVLIARFKNIFPPSYWTEQNFEINYHYKQIHVLVFKQHPKKLSIKIKHNYLDLLLKKNKSTYNPHHQENFSNLIYDFFNNLDLKAWQKVFYIPTNRSLFSFIKNDKYEDNSFLNLDYMSKTFINLYNRDLFKIQYLARHSLVEDYNIQIDQAVLKILQGFYFIEKDQDWICLKNRQKIKLIDASSGQQELLPIIIILLTFAFDRNSCFFLIENLENNLFPSIQNELVFLISLLYHLSWQRHSFFITTHSPYILTAFNTLIQAGNTYNKIIADKREHQLPELFKIVPKNQMLDINDIRVYSLQNGEIESIINDENQLIDANVIDEISNCTGEQFDQLLNLEFNND